MSRIPLLTPAQMTPAQRAVHDAVVSGPRGVMVGPLRAALHSPELAERWSKLGEFLRYDTVLEPRLSELAIIVTGRRWSSQIEWWIHAAAARKAGVTNDAIEAIRLGRAPVLEEEDEAEVYEFARALQMEGRVPAPLYSVLQDRYGVVGTVELGALIGYYTMVSMTLNLHELPLPDDVQPPLDDLADTALAPLARARRKDGSVWEWKAATIAAGDSKQVMS